jgi:hypothetical protein
MSWLSFLLSFIIFVIIIQLKGPRKVSTSSLLWIYRDQNFMRVPQDTHHYNFFGKYLFNTLKQHMEKYLHFSPSHFLIHQIDPFNLPTTTTCEML